MVDLDRISSSILRDIVELLRNNSVAKVRWSYIWYDDQADPDQIEYFDMNGNKMETPSWAMERLVEDYAYDHSGDFGDYELNVYTGEVEWIGGEPWRVPTSAGGAKRDDFNVEPISEWDLPEDEDEQEDENDD